MSIRPEFRRFYGREWRAYRVPMLKRAGYRCESCGRPHRLLNCAHETHDPRHSEIRVWCPSCHARHDAKHSYAVRRRTAAQRSGQLWIFPEMGFEPLPAWMRPRPAVDQGELFQKREENVS
jgi:hypothetical protein